MNLRPMLAAWTGYKPHVCSKNHRTNEEIARAGFEAGFAALYMAIVEQLLRSEEHNDRLGEFMHNVGDEIYAWAITMNVSPELAKSLRWPGSRTVQ